MLLRFESLVSAVINTLVYNKQYLKLKTYFPFFLLFHNIAFSQLPLKIQVFFFFFMTKVTLQNST